MPMANKLKTHKWAAKRFKITKKKKVLASKACNNHLLTNKGDNNKSDGYWVSLSKTYVKKVKTLFPYNQ